MVTASALQKRSLTARASESITELRHASIPLVEQNSLELTAVGNLAAMTGLAGRSAEAVLQTLASMRARSAAWFNVNAWREDSLSDDLIKDICDLMFVPLEAVDFLFDPAGDVGDPARYLRNWGAGEISANSFLRPLRYSKELLALWIRGDSVSGFGISIAADFLSARSPRKPHDIGLAAVDYIEDRLLMLQWMLSASLLLTPHLSVEIASWAAGAYAISQMGLEAFLLLS